MSKQSTLSLFVGSWLSLSAAHAGIVTNPIPPVTPGLTLGIVPFTTVPPTQPTPQKALIQSLQEVGDGSGRLFTNDTRGLIYVTNKSGTTPTPWFDIRTQGIGFSNATNSTQTGLMSFAFSPNFGRDPTLPGYNTFYTIDTSADHGTASWSSGKEPIDHDDVVHEWTVANPHAATAQITGAREVLRVAQPYSDHGPGTIAFNSSAKPGDADYGNLYIGLGDGGNPNDPLDNAQNLASPFGKILRINPADPDGSGPLTYSIPASNPFVGKDGDHGEIWAYGLRNPQHFSWDNKTGQMVIADIGQAQIEEVDVGKAGANYGWPAREGTFARGTSKDDENIYDGPPNDGSFTDPIGQYSHQEIGKDGHTLAAVSGVFTYEGTDIPELDGDVILSDLVTGRLFSFDPSTALGGQPATLHEIMLTLDGDPTTMLALEGTSDDQNGRVDLRLGEDADGEIYLLSKTNGDVYRLIDAPIPEPASWTLMIMGFGCISISIRRSGVIHHSASVREA